VKFLLSFGVERFHHEKLAYQQTDLAAARVVSIVDNLYLNNGLTVGDVPLFNSHTGKVANY
jgi:hypothetical protein